MLTIGTPVKGIWLVVGAKEMQRRTLIVRYGSLAANFFAFAEDILDGGYHVEVKVRFNSRAVDGKPECFSLSSYDFWQRSSDLLPHYHREI